MVAQQAQIRSVPHSPPWSLKLYSWVDPQTFPPCAQDATIVILLHWRVTEKMDRIPSATRE